MSLKRCFISKIVAYGRYFENYMNCPWKGRLKCYIELILREIAVKIQIYHQQMLAFKIQIYHQQMLAFKIKCQLLIKMEVLLRENYIFHTYISSRHQNIENLSLIREIC